MFFLEGFCKIGFMILIGEWNIFIKKLRGIKVLSCLENYYCICLVVVVNNNVKIEILFFYWFIDNLN